MRARELLVAAAVLLSATACASRQRGAAESGGEHPLVGRWWDVRASAWADESAALAAAARSDLVFLGETHDNPEHHRLQARVLQAMIAAGRRPAVAFEMLDTDAQPAIDASVAEAPRSADALASAVAWAKTGWPPFALYKPIFTTALDAGLPIVATNLSRLRARDVVSRGASVLEPDVRALLERAGPLPDDARKELREEMAQSHCGQMPDDMLDPLVEMQRARDAEIAAHVLAAAQGRGAVLIAGSGHVRTDRGVPSYVAREAPARLRTAIAFLEVAPDERSIDEYARQFTDGRFPYDLVRFTVRQEREDPCAGIEKRIHPIRSAPADATWVWRIDAPDAR